MIELPSIIVKAIGKTEVHSIDVSKQNIEVYDKQMLRQVLELVVV